MNREETIEAIKVMQAWVDGKRVQYKKEAEDETWIETVEPFWNWPVYKYRIKPEPREWEIYVLNGTVLHSPQDCSMGYSKASEKIKVREVIE